MIGELFIFLFILFCLLSARRKYLDLREVISLCQVCINFSRVSFEGIEIYIFQGICDLMMLYVRFLFACDYVLFL